MAADEGREVKVPFENGVNWEPLDPDKRGRHDTFGSAVQAAFRDLTRERNPFYDSLVDDWRRLFPSLPMRPGRYADGIIYLYVRTAPLLFAMRPRLPMVRKALLALPNAPKSINLRLEIHSK